MKVVCLLEPPFWFVPVAAVARHVNPLRCPPWEDCPAMSRALVARFIATADLEARPWDWGRDAVSTVTTHMQRRDDRDEHYHAKRVAYLVLNPSPVPIDLEIPALGIGYYPEYPVVDGNHRLAAAIYRRDRWIAIRYGGGMDEFEEMFPFRRRPAVADIQRLKTEETPRGH